MMDIYISGGGGRGRGTDSFGLGQFSGVLPDGVWQLLKEEGKKEEENLHCHHYHLPTAFCLFSSLLLFMLTVRAIYLLYIK